MDESFPSELQERVEEFDDALTQFEDAMKPMHAAPLSQQQASLSPLDSAKLELVGAFAINSLFWMYLNVKGQNPKEHQVKQELDRIRGYMTRVKEIEDKKQAPKLNKDASKRFVRGALWQAAQTQTHQTAETAPKEDSRKRKSTEKTQAKRKRGSSNFYYETPKPTSQRKFTL